MARPLRIEYPGALYHITSRGNAKEKIFLDDKDYYLFLKCLDLTSKRYNFLIYSFCLMPNHYHLLLETPEGNLSKIMRQLNGVYTQKFNKKYGRVGHIFQGRYKAILVEKERYLLELIRYINLNPVRAGLAEDPLEWKWSSLPYILNIKKKLPFLSEDFIFMQFSEEKSRAIKLVKEFIYAGIKRQSPFKNLKGQIFLGGDDFINKIK
ncbi:MAG: transposase, partial [Thermoanaerobaculia bacterium]